MWVWVFWELLEPEPIYAMECPAGTGTCASRELLPPFPSFSVLLGAKVLACGEHAMGTPDGISDRDWDGVRERAAELISHSGDDDADVYRGRLLDYLKDLETRYGRLPSILATRADFTCDMDESEALLLEAFQVAERSADQQAMVHTAHSLAHLYVQDVWDRSKAAFWLRRLEHLLTQHPDSAFAEDLNQLRNAYFVASRTERR